MKIMKIMFIGLSAMVFTMVISFVTLAKAFPVYVAPVIIDGNNPTSYIWLNRVDDISLTRNWSYEMTMLEKEPHTAVMELKSSVSYQEPILLDMVDTAILGEEAKPELMIAVIAESNNPSVDNAVTYYAADDYEYDNIGYFVAYSSVENLNTAKNLALILGFVVAAITITLIMVIPKMRENKEKTK